MLFHFQNLGNLGLFGSAGFKSCLEITCCASSRPRVARPGVILVSASGTEPIMNQLHAENCGGPPKGAMLGGISGGAGNRLALEQFRGCSSGPVAVRSRRAPHAPLLFAQTPLASAPPWHWSLSLCRRASENRRPRSRPVICCGKSRKQFATNGLYDLLSKRVVRLNIDAESPDRRIKVPGPAGPDTISLGLIELKVRALLRLNPLVLILVHLQSRGATRGVL